MSKNVILATDSYKLGHHGMYPAGTKTVYSYLEAREGARYPYTVFFGLQSILKRSLVGKVLTSAMIDEAEEVSAIHFGNADVFDRTRWDKLLTKHDGMLPIRIKAVPEGTVVPVGNVLMTVQNTDPEFPWLTNALESALLHVWYPSTVATEARVSKETIASYLERTADSLAGLPFAEHDFGYRGATGDEAAALGGAAHLVSFMGTDTLPALLLARDDYSADLNTLGFSVPATEHSIMTARGAEGEYDIVEQLLDQFPTGILSVVADSYDYYGFVDAVCTRFRDRIASRDGKFVVRPDSPTPTHPNPESLVVWTADRLAQSFGAERNRKSYKVLDPHVGILWGDGLDLVAEERILAALALHDYSTENVVFGKGGAKLQKVNRDTQRFAFKASAMEDQAGWHDVQKNPLDQTKKSKAGLLKLSQTAEGLVTVRQDNGGWHDHTSVEDVLQIVFNNGFLRNEQSFDEIRERAALPVAVAA